LVVLVAALMTVSGFGGAKAWRALGTGDTSTEARGPATAPDRRPVVPSASAGSGSAVSASARSAAAPDQQAMLVAGDQTGPVPQQQPTATGEPSAPRATAGISAGPIHAAITAGPGKAAATVSFGPWKCGYAYSIDLGHPVLTRPCHSVGPTIRATGRMEAVPGVQADISLTVRDADTDEVMAGPYTCRALMFTDFDPEHACGPVDLQAPHGGRYRVAESWEYTGRSILPGGVTRGPAFDW
jgi:hypothetical protein